MREQIQQMRKWVCKHGEAWIDDMAAVVTVMNGWTRTDDVREVPDV